MAEDDWHVEWKFHAPKERREVRIGKHRADVVISFAGEQGVIEFQNSPISEFDIRKREHAYERGWWVYNEKGFRTGLRVRTDNSDVIGWRKPPDFDAEDDEETNRVFRENRGRPLEEIYKILWKMRYG